MTRTKQAAQRGTGGKLFPRRPRPSDQSAEPSPRRPPSQQPENETTNSTSTSDRLAQIQQVDSWRSYRDDTTNLQTATGSESPYSPPLPFGTSQQQVRPLGSQIQAQEMSSPPPLGQQVYPPPLQTMDPTALSFRSSTSTEHSHFTPYQPLRVSNGVAERQRIQLATNASQSLPQVQPQSQAQWQPPVQPQYQAQAQWQLSVQPQGHAQGQTHGQNQLPDRYRLRPRPEAFRSPLPETRRTRYPLRQRTDEQTAPYSTGVADQILSSVETWGASSRFIPHARRASSRPLSTVETSGNTSPQYIPQVQGASPRPNWNKEVPGPAAPTPTKEYKRDAEFDPVVRPEPQKLLVVLDLNGTLLVRPNKRKPQNIIVRPGVPALLDYLFRNHVVMIYSSAKPQNCAAMIDKFFLPDQRAILAAVWARDKLGLTQIQYDSKVQVYKKLEPIWQDQRIQNRAEPGKRWDHSNTVLVDDSQLKALAQPHNLLQVPEFLNNEPTDGIQAKLDWRRGEEAIVHSVQQKLEQLKWQVSVTRLIREWQTGKRQAPGVVDETVDQNALHREGGVPSPSPAPSMGDREPSHEPQQLQTPRDSPMSGVEEDRPQYVPVEVQSDDGVSSGDEGGATLNGLEAQIDRNLSLHQSPPDRNMDQNRQTAGAATGVGAVATTKMLGRKRPKNIKVGTPEYSAWIQARKKYRNDHKAEIKAERKKKRQAKDTAFKVAKVVRQRLHQQQQVTPSAKETRKMVAQAMQKMTLRD